MDETLDFAPCGYVSFQDDGAVLAVNQTLADLLEIPKDKIIGRSVETILTVASRIFYHTHLFPLLKLHERADEIFISLRGKDKKDVPVLVNGKRRKSGDQYLNDFILMPIHERKKYEDEILSAKRKAEDQVKQNEQLILLTETLESRTHELDQQYTRLLAINKDLLQFSRIISHDVQEALHKMSVFTDKLSIEESSRLSEKGNKTLERITNAVQKANELMTGLTQFILTDSDVDVTQVDLNKAIKAAKLKAEKDAAFKDFEFIVDTLPEVQGNEVQLQAMFYHLIRNAIQFRNPKKRLTISLEHILLQENKYRSTKDKYKYTDHLKINFRDNGSGFDNTYNEYVFSLFKKIHNDSPGLGIGLSLAKKIIENHSGLIEVKSEPGQGTEFTIILPVKSD
jgi:sigma-B regulation protein RsbU (phosphoserine phosphatase)